MGLFSNKSQTQEEPLYKTSYLGFWIKVYPNRVEFKNSVGTKSIPMGQIASVQLAMAMMMKITIETTGGQKYPIPTTKKKEVQQAIYDAQAKSTGIVNSQTDLSDQIFNFKKLKDKGIITQKEFDEKKKQLLGL